MLTLVESCDALPYWLDRPNLGCAMLIAACQQKGIKTTLIRGQTRWIKDMFTDDSEELWGLIQDLRPDAQEALKIGPYKTAIRQKGVKRFKADLNALYQNVVLDRNPRNYFNAARTGEFQSLLYTFMAVYSYYAEELGHCNLKIIDRYVLEIVKTNPRYIGFSQLNFGPLSRVIRQRIKDLTGRPVIVGGSFTPYIDFKKLNDIAKTEYFDHLVIGPGEHSLVSLIAALESQKRPAGIPNVYYRENGEIRGNRLEIVGDLNSLPCPDYSQFDLDLYSTPIRVLPLQTARGCTWRKCSFCSHHAAYLGKYRCFSVDNVIRNLAHLKTAHGCSHFVLHDAELPPERALNIAKAISAAGLKDISICTYARLTDAYNNSKLLRTLRRAGFASLVWGLESGCQKVLDLMCKGTKTQTIRQILRKSAKTGIANVCFVMFGHPGETAQDARQTVEFLKNNSENIDGVLYLLFRIVPGHMPIAKNPAKWGIDVKPDGTYSARNGMSHEEALAFLGAVNLSFSLNKTILTSGKLRHVGVDLRMANFLNAGHKLLTRTACLKLLKKRELSDIFPLILGHIERKSGKAALIPVNYAATPVINKLFPEQPIILNRLEERLFILADGRLSIEEIAVNAGAELNYDGEKKSVRIKCARFFRDIFSRKLGLAYAKSWRNP